MWFLVSPFGRTIVLFLVVIASYFAAYWKGRTVGWDAREERYQAELREQAKRAAILARKREIITERVAIQYKDRVRVIHERGEAIREEVLKFVPAVNCDLDPDWRVLHDAAATGSLPQAPKGTDGPAPVPQGIAIGTVAANYESCHANAEKLRSLQEWVRQQSSLSP